MELQQRSQPVLELEIIRANGDVEKIPLVVKVDTLDEPSELDRIEPEDS